MSPGFRLRPSLSEPIPGPATPRGRPVSPGFRLRPSLSAARRRVRPRGLRVSPGFRLRPSLSDTTFGAIRCSFARVAGVQTPAFVERRSGRPSARRSWARVAGVQTPAFVERSSSMGSFSFWPGVAGVQTPAFVERFCVSGPAYSRRPVSPGFRLRPSLSDRDVGAGPRRHPGCRRGSDSGLR